MGMPLVCARAKRLASGSSFCISRHNIGSNAWMQGQSCLDRPIGIFAMRQPKASVDDDIQMIRDLIAWSGDNAGQIARNMSAANTPINRDLNGSGTPTLGRGARADVTDEKPGNAGGGQAENGERE